MKFPVFSLQADNIDSHFRNIHRKLHGFRKLYLLKLRIPLGYLLAKDNFHYRIIFGEENDICPSIQ